MERLTLTSLTSVKDWFNPIYDVYSYDWETTNLSYLNMDPVGIAFCNGVSSCYIPLSNFQKDILFYIKNLFIHENILWIAHNQSFDLKCCRKFCKSEPFKIWCSLVGAKLLDENRFGNKPYSLKTLAVDWLRVKNITKYEEVCINIHNQKFAEYAMDDAVNTYNLYKYEYPRLEKEGLLYLAEKIEMPYQKCLADLEINGIAIDKEKLNEFAVICASILNNIEYSMLAIFNKKHNKSRGLFGQDYCVSPINFRSIPQLRACIDKLGFTIDDENPSIGKVYLEKMKGRHEFFDLLCRYRKLQKLYNSFIEPADTFIDADGRIRPSYNMVRTGRLACSNPNCQQLPNPKKEKLEFNYREIFVPKNSDNVLIKADYSGQELRILAEISQDKEMINAFNNNLDLHLLTANRVFSLGLGIEAITNGTEAHTQACKLHKQKRHQAKNGINFPTVYGAFPKRIAEDNHVSVKEASRWLKEFNKTYPGVKAAVEKTRKELLQFGYVTTLMGRRRRFPGYKESGWKEKGKMERQAFNFKIQGFAADMLKITMNKIRLKLSEYDGIFVLMVHDEIVVECHEKISESCAAMIKNIMEHCVNLSIPIEVDVDIVRTYGD